MKDTIATILQSWMDKCTSEQFWAAGAVGALNAYLVAEHDDVSKAFPARTILIFSSLAALYAVYFIIQRHFAYYWLQRQLVAVIKLEDVPEFMKKEWSLWRGHSLSGVVFYVGVVVTTSFGVVATYK